MTPTEPSQKTVVANTPRLKASVTTDTPLYHPRPLRALGHQHPACLVPSHRPNETTTSSAVVLSHRVTVNEFFFARALNPQARNLDTASGTAHEISALYLPVPLVCVTRVAWFSARSGMCVSDPIIRPPNPMARNWDSATRGAQELAALFRPKSPRPLPPYSPLSPSYSSLPVYSPPQVRMSYPPLDYEAYTEEYGNTHPSHILRKYPGYDKTQSTRLDILGDAGSKLLQMAPGLLYFAPV